MTGFVTTQMPAPMRRIPSLSERLSDSWSAIADKSSPRPGTASNTMAIVVARTKRPTSTAAQYAKAVAIGPTYERAARAGMGNAWPGSLEDCGQREQQQHGHQHLPGRERQR